MPDIFPRINPGEKLRPSARAWNALMDVAEDRLTSDGFSQNGIDIGGGRQLWAKNTTTDTLGLYSIVGIGGAVTDPAEDEAEFQENTSFKTIAPATGEQFAILQNPAEPDCIVEAVARGHTQCLVNRTSDTHQFADADDGEYEHLVSQSDAGPARIFNVSDLPAAASDAEIHTGTGAPSGGLGSDGDYYRDTVGEQYYGPKTAGSWGSAHDYGTGICWAVVVLEPSPPVVPTYTVTSGDGTVGISTTVAPDGDTAYDLAARVADLTQSGIVSVGGQDFQGPKGFKPNASTFTYASVYVYGPTGSLTFSGTKSIGWYDQTTYRGMYFLSAVSDGINNTVGMCLDEIGDSLLLFGASGSSAYAVIRSSTIYRGVDTAIGGIAVKGGIITGGTFSIAESDLASQAVAPSKLKDADFGAFTIASGVATLDAGVVSPSNLADGDFGDFSVSSGVATIDADAVTNAKLANAAAYSFKANLTSGSANPTDVTLADLTAEAAPASGDYFLAMLADGSFAKVDYDDLPGGGAGDVTAASNFGTDNRLIRSDGTTKGVQASGITVDDSDNVTGVTTLNKVAITAPATGSTLTIADGKTLTVSNTITITATDGSTLAIGAGGTLGSAAYTASTAYAAVANNLSDLANAGTSRTNLGGTTVGQSYFTLTNPGAITFPRMNADNTVSALSASDFRTAIGAGTGGGDALTTNPLSQFAATTSAQLAGVISDETGTGLLVFGTAPTLASTVTIGTAGGTTGAALLKGTTSGTVTLSVADAAGTHTIKLPTADGTNGQSLTTNGSGQWGWSTVSGSGTRISPVTETAKSTTFTAVWGEYYPCSGTSYTITLPTASGNAGKICAFRSAASGTLTIDGNSSETVGGRTTLALITGDYIELQSDGTNVQIAVFTHADWVSYTPTINAVTTNPTKGATRTEVCLYKRDGHDMLIQFLYRQNSAGSAGSGTYLFVLPLSASTDGTFVQTGVATSASTVGSLLGNGQAIIVSVGVVGSIGVYAYDSTNLRLSGIYDGSGAGGGQVGSGFFAMSLTDVDYMFTARVPISGW